MRLKEAIKYANDQGNKVTRMDIAAALWPNSSENSQRFNINSLVSKRTKKVAPDWVRMICEICGVDANFLFSETDKQKAKRKSRAGYDGNGSNFNSNAKDGQGVGSERESAKKWVANFGVFCNIVEPESIISDQDVVDMLSCFGIDWGQRCANINRLYEASKNKQNEKAKD